ncbi:MAG: hypothetical protein A3A43_01745 [Candidatus Liptonbacteria bacterium RIFCSPLOWO2_01_FULL_56_20]|uniref:Uncharacterized protein n=1 Tax=Candidatus Liptonbacteria bacterium RIFCSPLOWO2_01_FULL_56_20 TaxID=1798652 RepID=A0A1G2CLS9_9BACT|nr:MAG: hypothetical protein A2681_02995 [Candidatus Liptonbacteria bacterium RIFCSPHIGHO2_01_FULL_56_18b]OGZ01611.1 MAG: hypothetical protein A3A43_01745 [Candidatus Liptonbacteria bacterium RIFCSPLOWO2_01_FULL_56_20]
MKMFYRIRYSIVTAAFGRAKARVGQSLVEILIAVAVGMILVVGGISVIVPALRSNTDAGRTQVAVGLGRALLDNVRAWSEADWHNITSISSGPGSHYYLNATSSPFTVAAGDESVAAATTTYRRYFYVEDVLRDASENIVTSGGVNDPSTKKVTVAYGWLTGPMNTLGTFVTRSRNKTYQQTNWSGGGGFEGPATTTNSQFSTSTPNIDFQSIPGSITLTANQTGP